jgi:hypothetical protein
MFLKTCKEKLQKNIILKQERMKANELRIGNFIKYNNEQIGIVSGIQEFLFNNGKVAINQRIDIFYHIENINPIALTEEILLKCGFKDNNYSLDLKLGTKKITFNWYSRIVLTGVRNGYYCQKYKHIKYLHQLQNLYFALTGKELEYENYKTKL